MENSILIFLLILAACSLFILGSFLLAHYYRAKKDLSRRLEQVEGTVPDAETRNEARRPAHAFLKRLGSLGKFLEPKKEENISEMKRMFVKAGVRRENAISIFFGLKVLLALSFFAAAFVGKLLLRPDMPQGQFIYVLLLSIIIGFYLPNIWIKLRTADRKERIQRGIPDALDLMVVCVEAGVGLDAAINKIAEEIRGAHPALADELHLVTLEIRAGKQRQQALRNLVWRTELDDLSSLTTLLIQTEKFGTSIAQALRVYSDSMRTKRYQRAEEIAQKMPVKLLFPLALFILPMFLLVVLGPVIAIFMKYL